jgi:hypothetical protein
MDVSAVERDEKDDDGRIFRVKITSYHCNMCHTFVRSEDEKISLSHDVRNN